MKTLIAEIAELKSNYVVTFNRDLTCFYLTKKGGSGVARVSDHDLLGAEWRPEKNFLFPKDSAPAAIAALREAAAWLEGQPK